jgi:hypothetical protein
MARADSSAATSQSLTEWFNEYCKKYPWARPGMKTSRYYRLKGWNPDVKCKVCGSKPYSRTHEAARELHMCKWCYNKVLRGDT